MEGIQTINALKAVQSSLPAQTTIPSNELVMLYAADGTPIAKIARDDLVKAVASVMASNSQTTFSKLLGVQANGTPMGIGASDLASVLGVTGIRVNGSNNDCFAAEVGRYGSVRLLGNDFSSSRGILDVSIYGNGTEGGASVKGTPGINNYKLKFYKKDDHVYMVVPTGMSTVLITTGIFQKTTLPGDATELTVTSY